MLESKTANNFLLTSLRGPIDSRFIIINEFSIPKMDIGSLVLVAALVVCLDGITLVERLETHVMDLILFTMKVKKSTIEVH